MRQIQIQSHFHLYVFGIYMIYFVGRMCIHLILFNKICNIGALRCPPTKIYIQNKIKLAQTLK